MWLKTLSLLLWLLFIHSTALAQSIVTVIDPPLAPIQAGREMVFTVYYHNGTDRAVDHSIPDQLVCRLTSGQTHTDVVALRIEPQNNIPNSIPANSFAKARFSLLLPKETAAEVQLSAPQISSSGLVLSVRPSAGEEQEGAQSFSWTLRSEDRPLDAFLAVHQPYAKNIAFYKPMYFLLGVDPEESKFQVSFKYRFFNPEKPLAKRYPWVEGFHLGYTQTSFWDLSTDSAPFEDTSYKPELFFISPRFKTAFTSEEGMFITTGIQHESNGQGGDESRGTNIAYIEPSFLFYNQQSQIGFKISPKVWFYFDNEEENNPDIADYRGYFNLGITCGKAGGLVIETNFQWADQGASVQVDVTYPLHILFFDYLDLYLHANYTNSLAERLINYEERIEAVRIGLAIVR